MTQSLLYIISNHSLDFSDKEKCIDAIKSQNIEWALEEYLFFVSHLTNTKPPKSQSVQLTRINHDEIWFLVNDIHIKIGKHIIQWKFPFIFRSFFDYLPLQKGVETLLATWFSSFGAKEYAAYPSFWEQKFEEVKNPLHKKRLAVLQDKICNRCVSYKRTKLNLELCLSKAVKTAEEMQKKQYRGWFAGELS